jgi:hypothetical protein
MHDALRLASSKRSAGSANARLHRMNKLCFNNGRFFPSLALPLEIVSASCLKRGMQEHILFGNMGIFLHLR